MRNIFFTADTHFDHGYTDEQGIIHGIIKHAHRPFKSVEEMNQKLIDNWNSVVHGGDIVYILGDFAWKNHKRFIHALRGKKVLITGSHDHMNEDCYSLFTEVHFGMLQRNFNTVPFTLTHCAMLVWEKSHYGAINLHAHSHMRLPEKDDVLRMDVGVDGHNYTPISLDFIMYIMNERKKKWQFKGRVTPEEANENVRILQERNRKLLEEWKKNIPNIPIINETQETQNISEEKNDDLSDLS